MALRALMAAARPVARFRRPPPREAISTRRYGTARDETLEIIEPLAQPASESEPAPVLYVHGGGWIAGNKALYSGEFEFLRERGHRIYNLDYPLAPEHPYPAALVSLLGALSWLERDYPDARAVHLMGDSAGGNLVTMLALMIADPALRRRLDPELADLPLPRVLSVISLYGVLDRTSWIEHGFPGATLMLHSYAGPGAFEAGVGPELAITPYDLPLEGLPPCFMAIGTNDALAPSSRLLFERLSAVQPTPRIVEYAGEGHGFFNQDWREGSHAVRRDILAFIEASSPAADRAPAEPRAA
jgi:acetyl esterase/lipase